MSLPSGYLRGGPAAGLMMEGFSATGSPLLTCMGGSKKDESPPGIMPEKMSVDPTESLPPLARLEGWRCAPAGPGGSAGVDAPGAPSRLSGSREEVWSDPDEVTLPASPAGVAVRFRHCPTSDLCDPGRSERRDAMSPSGVRPMLEPSESPPGLYCPFDRRERRPPGCPNTSSGSGVAPVDVSRGMASAGLETDATEAVRPRPPAGCGAGERLPALPATCASVARAAAASE
mmetsp:Transcript_4309/g.18214  ORF Transcript_4309/g.18214 Transcript_4309/m.18214 type:complete len:231 (+) Transcript_4309:56-748(+)